MKTNIHTSTAQNIFRILLGLLLLFTGTGHLSFVREEFTKAQVPDWIPLEKDLVVVLSGVVEILLGLSLIALSKYKVVVGWIVALFFVAIFPGNYYQYTHRVDAFGLNTDTLRLIRLCLHPLLVLWPLWACGIFNKKNGGVEK